MNPDAPSFTPISDVPSPSPGRTSDRAGGGEAGVTAGVASAPTTGSAKGGSGGAPTIPPVPPGVQGVSLPHPYGPHRQMHAHGPGVEGGWVAAGVPPASVHHPPPGMGMNPQQQQHAPPKQYAPHPPPPAGQRVHSPHQDRNGNGEAVAHPHPHANVQGAPMMVLYNGWPPQMGPGGAQDAAGNLIPQHVHAQAFGAGPGMNGHPPGHPSAPHLGIHATQHMQAHPHAAVGLAAGMPHVGHRLGHHLPLPFPHPHINGMPGGHLVMNGMTLQMHPFNFPLHPHPAAAGMAMNTSRTILVTIESGAKVRDVVGVLEQFGEVADLDPNHRASGAQQPPSDKKAEVSAAADPGTSEQAATAGEEAGASQTVLRVSYYDSRHAANALAACLAPRPPLMPEAQPSGTSSEGQPPKSAAAAPPTIPIGIGFGPLCVPGAMTATYPPEASSPPPPPAVKPSRETPPTAPSGGDTGSDAASEKAKGEAAPKEAGVQPGSATPEASRDADEPPEPENCGVLRVAFQGENAMPFQMLVEAFASVGELKSVLPFASNKPYAFVLEYFDLRDAARARYTPPVDATTGATFKVAFGSAANIMEAHRQMMERGEGFGMSPLMHHMQALTLHPPGPPMHPVMSVEGVEGGAPGTPGMVASPAGVPPPGAHSMGPPGMGYVWPPGAMPPGAVLLPGPHQRLGPMPNMPAGWQASTGEGGARVLLPMEHMAHAGGAGQPHVLAYPPHPAAMALSPNGAVPGGFTFPEGAAGPPGSRVMAPGAYMPMGGKAALPSGGPGPRSGQRNNGPSEPRPAGSGGRRRPNATSGSGGRGSGSNSGENSVAEGGGGGGGAGRGPKGGGGGSGGGGRVEGGAAAHANGSGSGGGGGGGASAGAGGGGAGASGGGGTGGGGGGGGRSGGERSHGSGRKKPREELDKGAYTFTPHQAGGGAAAEGGGTGRSSPQAGQTRTTLMIKNIPNKYSQKMLLAALDKSCAGKYDFFYLPIDFKNRCNLGYAFVNLTTTEAANDIYKEWHDKRWEEFNSKKVCEITYARVQGRQALLEHFRNSRFPCEDDEYLPLVFEPGHSKPKPLPVGIAANSNSSSSNNHSSGGGNPTAVPANSASSNNSGGGRPRNRAAPAYYSAWGLWTLGAPPPTRRTARMHE